eukprot:351851-Chlamydomonas_euryale.AAC.4
MVLRLSSHGGKMHVAADTFLGRGTGHLERGSMGSALQLKRHRKARQPEAGCVHVRVHTKCENGGEAVALQWVARGRCDEGRAGAGGALVWSDQVGGSAQVWHYGHGNRLAHAMMPTSKKSAQHLPLLPSLPPPSASMNPHATKCPHLEKAHVLVPHRRLAVCCLNVHPKEALCQPKQTLQH